MISTSYWHLAWTLLFVCELDAAANEDLVTYYWHVAWTLLFLVGAIVYYRLVGKEKGRWSIFFYMCIGLLIFTMVVIMLSPFTLLPPPLLIVIPASLLFGMAGAQPNRMPRDIIVTSATLALVVLATLHVATTLPG